MLAAKRATIDLDQYPTPDDVAPKRAANIVTMRKPSKGVNFPARVPSQLRAARAGSKQAALIDALARPEGATIDDLVRATG